MCESLKSVSLVRLLLGSFAQMRGFSLMIDQFMKTL